MSAKNKQLYFVAIIPPEDVFKKVHLLKEEVSELYQSHAALRSPPHITLHMPFRFREDREGQINQVLHDTAQSLSSIRITQSGFGAFPPRVIYVDVAKTKELELLREQIVKQMRLRLKLENADYKGRSFHPHMTIAFRDLKKSRFQEAWYAFKERAFEADWECKHVTLLKHSGKSWQIYQEYPFQGS